VVGIAAYFSTPDGLRRRRNDDAPHIGCPKALETVTAHSGAAPVGPG
jgi:hypothetical protein